ncbi:RNA polymerase sigma-70 factor [Sunxiuqinia elliptica]|uniref:RNA polymerase sigma-70 factor (ECF subfamily) n=1 Tax=Sunxiuqinia elliptica TaxID=655355 RepID=A0A4R6GPI3_9BACT|nr:RNA polymerase sigma-70 factor [Sunxiuqinia elliptica]TDN96355.1 RNA polymerase sigma-70 factor (ECF subfamily) [Sunxiuqinia elliptica]TDO68066.1 RNA polymerase sigma-70 factor (ECF subfamily) [Sunxiuqinia elliptica]
MVIESKGKHKFEKFKTELSQESFATFFDAYFLRLSQFACSIVKSNLLAEEIVLDVFLKLWESRSDLTKIKNIEPYLYISTRNKAISTLRKETKFHFDLIEDSEIKLTDYKPSAEVDLIEHELFDTLNKTVANLPPKCKIIFKLIREDGLNRQEVAEILNISVKTVDNQLAIAIRKIATVLNIDLSNPQNTRKLKTLLLSL